MNHYLLLVSFVTVSILAATISAQVTSYTDKSAWEAAAGDYATITFQEYPSLRIQTAHRS
jgi:hypothetical protein